MELQEFTPPLHLPWETPSTRRPLCKPCSSIQGKKHHVCKQGREDARGWAPARTRAARGAACQPIPAWHRHQDWASSTGAHGRPAPATASHLGTQMSTAAFGGTPESPKRQEGDSGGTSSSGPRLPAPQHPAIPHTWMLRHFPGSEQLSWLCATLPGCRGRGSRPAHVKSRQQSSAVAHGRGRGGDANRAFYTKVSGSSPGPAQHPRASLRVPVPSANPPPQPASRLQLHGDIIPKARLQNPQNSRRYSRLKVPGAPQPPMPQGEDRTAPCP